MDKALRLADFQSSHIFQAEARPFSAFELLESEGRSLHLKYAADSAVEQQGGSAFQCELDSEIWQLQFFRRGWRQREFYRVKRNDSLMLSTGVMNPWRWVDVSFSDGSVWQIRSGLLCTIVRNPDGTRILRASRKLGMILPRSVFHVEANDEPAKVFAVLIALLHFENHLGR